MTQPIAAAAAAPQHPPTPWWRVGFVWLVVGGPLAVVVASLVTAAIAVAGAEEVLTELPRGPSAHDSTNAVANPNANVNDSAAMPAMQARNHAATPKR